MVSQKKYDELMDLCKAQNETIVKLNKRLKQAIEEVRQATKLIGFYEACINKGVQVDFPNSTGGGKEEIEDGADTTFTFK